jgi:hypothetical protein
VVTSEHRHFDSPIHSFLFRSFRLRPFFSVFDRSYNAGQASKEEQYREIEEGYSKKGKSSSYSELPLDSHVALAQVSKVFSDGDPSPPPSPDFVSSAAREIEQQVRLELLIFRIFCS